MSRADTVGIIGAGRFGTALASALARADRHVVLWSRDRAVVDAIATDRRNPRVPDAPLPAPLVATSDLRQVARDAGFVVLAVRSTGLREVALELGAALDGSHLLVHAIGALAPPSGDRAVQRISDVIAERVPTQKLGALAGPALPADLLEGKFASMVAASAFDQVVAEARRLLNVPPSLRVYGSSDLAGVELASALSGAYTVALGLADGLRIGPGPRAVLITRAVAEASRLGAAAGAEARTFAGLAGLGNLLVRSSGDRSADYVLGQRLAERAGAATTDRTEGALAALAAVELARSLAVRVPVLDGLAAVLSGTLDAAAAAQLVGETVAAEE